MSENEKDENSLTESQENVEQSDVQVAVKSVQLTQQKIDELNDLLEKRNKNLYAYLQITRIWKNKLLIESTHEVIR